ncbi:MAG TPA: flagellar basal body P-ring formation chaperone FlgA [Dissulfurispiraceae bacterium]|nr:flagellar basal body P-ring formation chaperone FlgA [Dissulfurispiraceae bacterium]
MKTSILGLATVFMIALCFLSPCAWAGSDVLFDKIQKAVKENLANTISDKAELEELRIVRGAEYLEGGYRDLTIQNVYMDGYSGRNKAIYVVYLKDNASKSINVVVEASYDVFAEVYVTARPLSRGEAVTKDDYYTVRQKLSKLPSGVITDKSQIEGKVLKSSVTDGVIIRSNYLLTSVSIKRGQKVKIIVAGDNVEITSSGTIRSDATVGESANVLCDHTKKEVSGILVSPTMVKVKI